MDYETPWEYVWLAFQGRGGNITLLLLVVMTAAAAVIAFIRVSGYLAACHESAEFRRLAGRSLGSLRSNDLSCIAKASNSPDATVITSGLAAFSSAAPLGFDAALEAARRASQLAARTIQHRMRRGMNHLAAAAATVLLVGVFGTCCHLLTSFPSCGCSRESLRAYLFHEYSRALVPTVWGFLVAVPCVLVYEFLVSRLKSIDLAMEAATLELLNGLALWVTRQR